MSDAADRRSGILSLDKYQPCAARRGPDSLRDLARPEAARRVARGADFGTNQTCITGRAGAEQVHHRDTLESLRRGLIIYREESTCREGLVHKGHRRRHVLCAFVCTASKAVLASDRDLLVQVHGIGRQLLHPSVGGRISVEVPRGDGPLPASRIAATD